MGPIAVALITAGFIILAECVGFLAYKVFKLNKELKLDENNISALMDCIVKLSKAVQGVDVVEEYTGDVEDLDFPSKGGF